MVALTLSLSTPPIPGLILPSFSSSSSSSYSPSLRPNHLFFRRRMVVRAASSDEASSGASQYVGGIPVAEAPSFDTISYGEKFVSEVDVEVQAPPPPEEDPPQSIELLQNIKDFDSGDIIPIVLYGSGALVALWVASAVVRAIDSIPLFPKLIELVGLAYTVWFGYRYLLFQKDREELSAKIEELKQEVLGFDES